MRFVPAVIAVVAAMVAAVEPAFAETGAATIGSWATLGAPLGIGIAAAGGALGQGKIMAAALESIARNPGAADKMFLPWLLGVIFVESLVIYALVVAFLII